VALQAYTGATTVRFRKIEIKELPPPEGEWVSLFNNKDLTGWKSHPAQKGGWAVEGGDLVGRSATQHHLFSELGDYENFHLRADTKVNKHGNSGIFFRCDYDVSRGGLTSTATAPTGYEAQILNSYPAPARCLTGGLYQFADRKTSPVLTEEWFRMEVIARGNHLVVKVNGAETTNFVDRQNSHRRGHLALQAMSDAVVNAPTVVRFRTIEVKRLP